eukprot:376624_1
MLIVINYNAIKINQLNLVIVITFKPTYYCSSHQPPQTQCTQYILPPPPLPPPLPPSIPQLQHNSNNTQQQQQQQQHNKQQVPINMNVSYKKPSINIHNSHHHHHQPPPQT